MSNRTIIDTGGGASIGGDVQAARDFIGRDQFNILVSLKDVNDAAQALLLVQARQKNDLAVQAAAHGVEVVAVSQPVLKALAETVTPQGLVGVAPFLDTDLGTALASPPRLVAVLHEVADPGNAGTVIRTADAAGADAVVMSGSSVDPYNGKCVRASAGSLWHLPVVAGARLEDVLQGLRRTGVQILATSGTGADDLFDLADGGTLAAPTAWLFGSEAHGLPAEALTAADRCVRLPLLGRAESLNVATAAAVCLYASAQALRR